MANKMYILVETDQSQADPISRIVSQLVDRLNQKPAEVCPSNSTHQSITIPTDSKHKSIDQPQIIHLNCEDLQSKLKTKESQKKFTGMKAAITAEATIDSSGQAKAKISVNTNQEEKKKTKKPEVTCQPINIEITPVKEPAVCQRRNGLDPTFSELRNKRRFEYFPLKTIIPDYFKVLELKEKQQKALISSGPFTNGSIDFECRRNRNSVTQQDCVKNLPEAKLKKYCACSSRKNGLQDKCDPVVEKGLKRCSKSK